MQPVWVMQTGCGVGAGVRVSVGSHRLRDMAIRGSRCSIIPPYVLEAMATSGEPALEVHAREALAHDEALRAGRRTGRSIAPGAPGAPGAPTAPGRTAEAGTEPAPAPVEPQQPGPRRTVGDAEGRMVTPGTTVRSEGDPATSDPAVDEAYDGLGATWELWWAAYRRDSLDGKGMPLIATVHYGRAYDNAFWDGGQMVFGDGDGVVFDRFTRSLDVIGHELAHGVTEHTAGLRYRGQPGALNEHVSDVFGVLVRQHALGQSAAEADWLVGAELFLPGVEGRALRDMRNPGTAYDDPRIGKDPQPAHMRDYVHTTDDHGGVHINSGIPNRAFVLAATAIGGNAWDGAGAIWQAALTGDGIRADCDFETFAELTLAAAVAAHGDGSAQHVAVREAWREVGVLTDDVGMDEDPPVDEARDDLRDDLQDEVHGEVPGADAELLLRRTGGFGGLVRERRTALADLPDRDARDWQHLLAAPTLQRIAAIDEQPHPDAFCYSVHCAQIDLDVTVAEPHLPEAIHQLFERTLSAR